MPRIVIVATGPDLDSLPDEVQDVANIYSDAGWTVRLCIGKDASRAGMTRAADEGPAELVWLGCHSDGKGFGLEDGPLPPAELGRWLARVGASECVLNACYSLEHATAIQRLAPVGIACAIDPKGVDDLVAWGTGVAIARRHVETGNMAQAVAAATGQGIVQYRYLPARRRGTEGGRGMPVYKNTEEQLAKLVRAVLGEPDAGYIGLVAAVTRLQSQIASMAEEQRVRNEEQHIWRAEVDRKIAAIEHDTHESAPPSARVTGLMVGAFAILALILLYTALRWGGA